MVRPILAVVAGFVLWSVLWLGTNTGLQAAGMMPTDFTEPFTAPVPLLILLAGSVAFSLIAGSATACIAGANAARPVLILALILLAVGVLVQGMAWDKLPVWYHVPFLALLVPATMIGGRVVAPRAGAKA